ncbi:MAG: hypothetical protein V1781_02370 [Bacteroidota bacterium]
MSGTNKTLLFLLGISIGLLAGAGFFFFKIDDMITSMKLFKSIPDTIIVHQRTDNDSASKNIFNKTKKVSSDKSSMKNSLSSAKSFAMKYSHEIPSKKVLAESDSLLNDSTTNISAYNSKEDIVIVKKDELIETSSVVVMHLDENDETKNPNDSLLEQVSGIKDKQKNAIASFKIEFWQSPINYKGYKMTKNKIVLFGINTIENIKLFHLDENIFLKVGQNIYKLYFTDEFKQFEKVNDASLLAKLNR